MAHWEQGNHVFLFRHLCTGWVGTVVVVVVMIMMMMVGAVEEVGVGVVEVVAVAEAVVCMGRGCLVLDKQVAEEAEEAEDSQGHSSRVETSLAAFVVVVVVVGVAVVVVIDNLVGHNTEAAGNHK